MTIEVPAFVLRPEPGHRSASALAGRIERLVAGPYLELFARSQRPGWDAWGDEIGKFAEAAE